ncbi:transcription factor HEC3 [Lycium ferocissimum]|uniref:transcription factor HEC3 n=1 Tax=Lycium ferocissimum TaxID=112874 RepID=UPI002814B294|nr:transcription factor HEC3 [Lycium ferocissimum]
MERKLLFGETFLPLMESDEAFTSSMYENLSYQSLLSLSLNNNNNYNNEVKPLVSPFQPSLTNNIIPYASPSSQIQQTLDFPDTQKLKFPKLEPVTDDTTTNTNNNNLQLYDPYNNNEILPYLNEPLHYFSNTTLPDLRCFEHPNYFDFHYGATSSPVPKNTSSASTRLRKKLSEKTRCLEKLLPWDTKMDTATMLEEAYKYVKFLQAQVSVLQSMPTLAEEGSASPSSSEDRNGKTISVLNRQQLLQVVLNSPVAQTYLYSKGCCVYSVEQIVQYRKIAQRNNALYRQALFYSGMLSSTN